MKEKTRNIVRWIWEIAALILFFGLTVAGKLQLWFAIFMLGVLISVFAGRFYCGWICPMNTIFRPLSWFYGKLKIKRLKSPKFLSGNGFRYFILILFLALMIFVRILHVKMNILLYLTMLSVLVSLVFEEAFWHRKICPFGTILSLTSRKAKVAMNIDESGCIGCGACQKKCPSDSIITKEDGKRYNLKHECLMCYQCIDACPTKVCEIGTIQERKI
ncbi:MAG: 4Fe-4S binding protein [Spirochaetales bacterium]|nr:4Fe-4S binding protein [Spirochaetales bacterium]